jgi:hypothetical protein
LDVQEEAVTDGCDVVIVPRPEHPPQVKAGIFRIMAALAELIARHERGLAFDQQFPLRVENIEPRRADNHLKPGRRAKHTPDEVLHCGVLGGFACADVHQFLLSGRPFS